VYTLFDNIVHTVNAKKKKKTQVSPRSERLGVEREVEGE